METTEYPFAMSMIAARAMIARALRDHGFEINTFARDLNGVLIPTQELKCGAGYIIRKGDESYLLSTVSSAHMGNRGSGRLYLGKLDKKLEQIDEADIIRLQSELKPAIIMNLEQEDWGHTLNGNRLGMKRGSTRIEGKVNGHVLMQPLYQALEGLKAEGYAVCQPGILPSCDGSIRVRLNL